MEMTSPASFDNEELRVRISANLTRIQERIVSTGRDLSSVRIVAVSKTFGLDDIRAALSLGLVDFGENYVDELVQKHHDIEDQNVSWRYLGALQTNKIAKVLSAATVVCGVSRSKEIEKIATLSPAQRIYVQVDFTGQENRNGAPANEVADLVNLARERGLTVEGVMTVPSPGLASSEAAFRGLVDIADQLGIRERSMGMTDDLELACSLGSTEIRIGRALFGQRTYA